jgi:4'-phosphopantetheinyl transferase
MTGSSETVGDKTRHLVLWWVDPNAVTDPYLLDSYRARLTDEERTRQGRFVRPQDRQSFLVSRMLVRTALSRYADVAPAAWIFRRDGYGRPEIDRPRSHRFLRFNLAHTDGLAVCAVVPSLDVGVDAEQTAAPVERMSIAEQAFAPAELAVLRTLPAREQQRRFFELWTLKESYIKARGLGLSLPLDQFWFELEPAGCRIQFTPAIQDEPRAWQFVLCTPVATHQVAVALRRGQEPDWRVDLRHIVPPAF